MNLIRLAIEKLKSAMSDSFNTPSSFNSQVSIRSTLPEPWKEIFSQLTHFKDSGNISENINGCYLSSYVDNQKLLVLLQNGDYHLLFWNTDNTDAHYNRTRHYTGAFSFDGQTIVLDIELNNDSLGSDANDCELTVMVTNGSRYLLQNQSLEDIAQSVHWANMFGRTDQYFIHTSLDSTIPDYLEDGIASPPWQDFPAALKAVTRREPLITTITKIVSHPTKSDDDDGEYTVEISHGTDHGLLLNTPLCSPAADPKGLIGWVWGLDAQHCQLGLMAQTDDQGQLINIPQIGDTLITRQPGLPSLS
jgi:hypothetical protein